MKTRRDGYLLNRDKGYWERFKKDGALDVDAILAKKYKPEQVPFILEEMQRRGWL